MTNPLTWAVSAFWRRWGAGYPTWLLLGGATLLMGMTLTEAGWVENPAPLTASLVWGLIFGAALARSRFGGWFSLLHSQVLSLAFGLQTIGSVLPSWSVLTTRPSVEAVALTNARLLVLGERLSGWVSALLAGESVRDTGLFILLMGWLAWNASAWLAWALLRRQQALAGVLPYGALFALNLQLSDQDLWLFAAFLICALPLAARGDFNQRHAEWERRRVDYPDELGAEWGVWALLAVIAIAVAARLFVFVATPQGWQALSEAFRPLRQTVEDTTSRLFADVSPPRYQPTAQSTPRPSAQTPALTTLGAPPLQSSLLVMWVRTDGPIPAPPELEERGMVGYSVPVRYWRSEFYAAYTGSGWQVPAWGAPSPLPPSSPTLLPVPSGDASQGEGSTPTSPSDGALPSPTGRGGYISLSSFPSPTGRGEHKG